MGLERLVFFSDAVFAIAITLLALEIRLPEEARTYDDAQLLAALLGNWQSYLAYIISFLVIGTFWMSHHRKFGLIARYDRRLIFLNLLILMVVAFVPFPSSILSTNGSRTATIFYALTMALIGLLFAALWWHASQHNYLLVAGVDARRRRRELVAPLMASAFFLGSVAVAFVDADLSRISWVLILVTSPYLNRT